MSDKKPDFITVTDPHNCPVTFASVVAASGHHNGVVNLTLAQARFTPSATGVVDPDFIVAARLRMDIACAMQLRDQLERIIGQVEAGAKQALATALVTTAAPGPSGKAS